METKLIMLSNPILVSDEKIKEGDFYFKYDRILQWVKETSVTYTHIHPSNYPKPIIAGLPDLPKLNLSLISDEIGWVDVEKLAYQAAEKSFKRGINKWENKGIVKFFIDTYIEGFKAAQSLNERKWIDDDMIDFHNFIFNHPNQFLKMGEYLEEFKQSIKPKEYLVEVEMEVNQCDGCISGHPIIDGIHKAPCPSGSMVCKKHLYDKPKITNNTIKVTKIL